MLHSVCCLIKKRYIKLIRLEKETFPASFSEKYIEGN